MSEHIIIDAKNTYCPGPLMELIRCVKQGGGRRHTRVAVN